MVVSGSHLSGVESMKVNLKSIAGALLCGLLLVSLGASAGEKHKCKDGEKWNSATKACVKK